MFTDQGKEDIQREDVCVCACPETCHLLADQGILPLTKVDKNEGKYRTRVPGYVEGYNLDQSPGPEVSEPDWILQSKSHYSIFYSPISQKNF